MVQDKELEKKINRIIQGNCIEEMKKLPDGCIDSIFADPPYFMQTEGELLRTDGTKFQGVEDSWDKFADYIEYDKFCTEWLKECKRILKKDGSIWVIGAFQNIYRIGYIMQNMGFWILNDVVWSKSNAAPNFAGTRFQNSHETMLWCTKSKNSKYTFNYKTMKKLNNDKQYKSVWDIGLCIGKERLKDENGKKVHSTQKPSKLLYNVIVSSTKPGDIILDPFMGSGTTGAIAKLTGRNYIGFEMDETYIKYANERIGSIVPEINEITKLEYEVKPPKVPMEKLLETKYLTVGQELYNKDKSICVKVMKNGHVSDEEDVLSIHKMSAKHLGKTNNNGWDYFWVNHNNEFVELDSLRYIYNEQVNIEL